MYCVFIRIVILEMSREKHQRMQCDLKDLSSSFEHIELLRLDQESTYTAFRYLMKKSKLTVNTVTEVTVTQKPY